MNVIYSEKVVRRIMKEESLNVFITKRKKYNSYMGEISPSVENLIQRKFHAEKKNTKWLTDITEFAITAGKVYLSPVIDCYEGAVVNWTIGTSPNAKLVNTMLEGAIQTLKPGEHPIIHTDRGAHYRWPGWIDIVKNAGLIRSMSKKGVHPIIQHAKVFSVDLKMNFFIVKHGKNKLKSIYEKFRLLYSLV